MIEAVKNWWTVAIASVSFVGALAVGRYRLGKVEERQDKIEEKLSDSLYTEDHSQIYMSRADCATHAETCRTVFCAKVDVLRKTIDDNARRQAEFEKQTTETLMTISEKIGRALR
jgi:hypothetical protein